MWLTIEDRGYLISYFSLYGGFGACRNIPSGAFFMVTRGTDVSVDGYAECLRTPRLKRDTRPVASMSVRKADNPVADLHPLPSLCILYLVGVKLVGYFWWWSEVLEGVPSHVCGVHPLYTGVSIHIYLCVREALQKVCSRTLQLEHFNEIPFHCVLIACQCSSV